MVSGTQSFAKGVDMEDLGLRDPQALPGKGSAPMDLPDELTMPAWLKAHNKQVWLRATAYSGPWCAVWLINCPHISNSLTQSRHCWWLPTISGTLLLEIRGLRRAWVRPAESSKRVAGSSGGGRACQVGGAHLAGAAAGAAEGGRGRRRAEGGA